MLIILLVVLILIAFFLIKYASYYSFRITVTFLLGFIILFITNPPKEKFKSFYYNEVSKEEENQDFFNKLALEGVKLQAKLTLKEKNLKIFSIYQIDRLDKEIGYLGIFNDFVRIYEHDKAK